MGQTHPSTIPGNVTDHWVNSPKSRLSPNLLHMPLPRLTRRETVRVTHPTHFPDYHVQGQAPFILRRLKHIPAPSLPATQVGCVVRTDSIPIIVRTHLDTAEANLNLRYIPATQNIVENAPQCR